MDLNTMIEEKVPIIILAVFGTLISTFVVGALVFYIFPLLGIEMDFIYCFGDNSRNSYLLLLRPYF